MKSLMLLSHVYISKSVFLPLYGSESLRSVELFDVYTGDPIPAGKENLTYTLVYQATDRTLKDVEANGLQEKAVRVLYERFGATLR